MDRGARERSAASADAARQKPPDRLPKPPWLRVRLPSGESYRRIKELMRSKSLHTVCEEAMCPNIGECWACGTATFLVLGDVCTRRCGFCAVRTGNPRSGPPDGDEARELADAVAAMGLRHVVITSVTRDDLDDGGAALFAECIRRVRDTVPGCTVEVLIPDFQGDRRALGTVVGARPEVLAHNVETVPRLYPRVRPQADYRRSLGLLGTAGEMDGRMLTKSGFMVGLGETWDELMEVMDDLRDVGCGILTIGQYLSPTRTHLPVVRYYTPEEFDALREEGLRKGLRRVESGPFVRSSYHAEAQARSMPERLCGNDRADRLGLKYRETQTTHSRTTS